MSDYKYFLYSEEQLNEKNEILAKQNKTFVPGVVVVNGTRQNFTQLSDSNNMRYIDTKVVAEGDIKKITYQKPSTKMMGW